MFQSKEVPLKAQSRNQKSKTLERTKKAISKASPLSFFEMSDKEILGGIQELLNLKKAQPLCPNCNDPLKPISFEFEDQIHRLFYCHKCHANSDFHTNETYLRFTEFLKTLEELSKPKSAEEAKEEAALEGLGALFG